LERKTLFQSIEKGLRIINNKETPINDNDNNADDNNDGNNSRSMQPILSTGQLRRPGAYVS
jgi:hypothetical protein